MELTLSERTRSLARRLYRAIPLKRQLYGVLRRGPALPHSLYQHLHFEGPFTVKIDQGHSFRIHSDGSQVENDLFWSGFGGGWERTSLRVWAALCRDRRGLILDIGANTGVYALAAAALAPDAEIAAFEPIARMAEQLSANVALNDFAIAVEQKAVSDRSGRLPIYDTMVDHNYSASLEGQGSDALSYEVDVVSLDDWLAGRADKRLSAIKIDVERHEPAAVRGMRNLLATQRPSILIEILNETISAEVRQLIDGVGYRVYQIDERNGLIPSEQHEQLRYDDRNYLLCTAEEFARAELGRYLARNADARDESL